MHRIQFFILVLRFEITTARSTAAAAATTTTTTTAMYHSRFLSHADFDQLSTLSTAAATSATMPTISRPQIIQWSALEVGAVFRVIDRVTIPTRSTMLFCKLNNSR